MKIPVNISNDAVCELLVKHGLATSESIERDGNKMIKPTRAEAVEMLEKLPDETSSETNNPKPPETENKSNEPEPWSQDKQANPNRYYVIPKKLKCVDDKGAKVMEEVTTYFVNGMWCEDPAGTVECSYYDDLRPEVQELYRSQGIIR